MKVADWTSTYTYDASRMQNLLTMPSLKAIIMYFPEIQSCDLETSTVLIINLLSTERQQGAHFKS